VRFGRRFESKSFPGLHENGVIHLASGPNRVIQTLGADDADLYGKIKNELNVKNVLKTKKFDC
jgi:hypothetical protein